MPDISNFKLFNPYLFYKKYQELFPYQEKSF